MISHSCRTCCLTGHKSSVEILQAIVTQLTFSILSPDLSSLQLYSALPSSPKVETKFFVALQELCCVLLCFAVTPHSLIANERDYRIMRGKGRAIDLSHYNVIFLFFHRGV